LHGVGAAKGRWAELSGQVPPRYDAMRSHAEGAQDRSVYIGKMTGDVVCERGEDCTVCTRMNMFIKTYAVTEHPLLGRRAMDEAASIASQDHF
jgi:hypothetical protein